MFNLLFLYQYALYNLCLSEALSLPYPTKLAYGGHLKLQSGLGVHGCTNSFGEVVEVGGALGVYSQHKQRRSSYMYS